LADQTEISPESDPYGADQIQHLQGIEGIRHRPAMYISGTDLSGLHHLVYEVTDNVLDEYVNGFAKSMKVEIHGDGSITVTDDGRGIPVERMDDQDSRSALEVVFTEIHAGAKFDRKAYATEVCTAWASRRSMPVANGWKRKFAAMGMFG